MDYLYPLCPDYGLQILNSGVPDPRRIEYANLEGIIEDRLSRTCLVNSLMLMDLIIITCLIGLLHNNFIEQVDCDKLIVISWL